MARRQLIWHLGLAHPARAVVGANLTEYAGALAASGVQVAACADETRRATHEILRSHRGAGLDRADVEGRWARICDRVWEHRGVSVLSTPDLCVADKDQIRLALDPLIGIEVHLVVTVDSFSQQLYGGWLAELRAGRSTGWDKYVRRALDHAAGLEREHRQAERFWEGHDLPTILARWGWTLHDDRLHVLAHADPARQWADVVALVGLDPDPLPAVLPPYADPAGVAVLRKVNRQLETPVWQESLDHLLTTDEDLPALPVAPTSALAPLVERWETTLVAGGHDLRGDLRRLLDEGDARSLPGPRDQLGVAVDALADAVAENDRLRREVSRLRVERDQIDRLRRRWKKRARKRA